MKLKNKGAAIYQYIIIIVLIMIVIVPAFSLVGNYLQQSFGSFLSTQEESNKQIQLSNSLTGKAILNGTVKGGQLGGSADNPIRECLGNTCSIDFGTIVLNAIPANYNEIIETSGTSGGTEELLDLLQQLLKQIEEHPEKYPPDQVAKIQRLIGQGKDLIAMEKYIEDRINNNKTTLTDYYNDKMAIIDDVTKQLDDGTENFDASYKANFTNLFNEKLSTLINQNSQYAKMLKELINFGNSDNTYTTYDKVNINMDTINCRKLLDPNSVILINNDGSASKINSLETSNTSFDDYLKYQYPSQGDNSGYSPMANYLIELQTILNDNDINTNVKDITKTLSKEIFELASGLNEKSKVITEALDNKIYFCPTCGGPHKSHTKMEEANDILNAKPSIRTRLDLSVICGSNRGEFNKDNITCNKKQPESTEK